MGDDKQGMWRVFDRVKVLLVATHRGKVIFSLRRIYVAAVAHRGRGNCYARGIALEGTGPSSWIMNGRFVALLADIRRSYKARDAN